MIRALFVEKDILSRFVEGFTLHLALCLETYTKLYPFQNVTPNQVLLCTSDQHARAEAEHYCFQTFPVSGPWNQEHLQTFTVFKKYQTTAYECKINVSTTT